MADAVTLEISAEQRHDDAREEVLDDLWKVLRHLARTEARMDGAAGLEVRMLRISRCIAAVADKPSTVMQNLQWLNKFVDFLMPRMDEKTRKEFGALAKEYMDLLKRAAEA